MACSLLPGEWLITQNIFYKTHSKYFYTFIHNERFYNKASVCKSENISLKMLHNTIVKNLFI